MIHKPMNFYVICVNDQFYLTGGPDGCPSHDGTVDANVGVAYDFGSIYEAEQEIRNQKLDERYKVEIIRYHCQSVPWRKVYGKNYPDFCPNCSSTEHEPGTCGQQIDPDCPDCTIYKGFKGEESPQPCSKHHSLSAIPKE